MWANTVGIMGAVLGRDPIGLLAFLGMEALDVYREKNHLRFGKPTPPHQPLDPAVELLKFIQNDLKMSVDEFGKFLIWGMGDGQFDTVQEMSDAWNERHGDVEYIVMNPSWRSIRYNIMKMANVWKWREDKQ